MIKTILLFSSLLLTNFLSAQCRPMSESDFQSVKQRLSGRSSNSFQLAMEMSRTYCMTSSQARDLASYLQSDRDKMDFLIASFPTVVDKENFTDVMDVFRLMSQAFRLYHYTLGAASNSIQNPNPRNQNRPNNPGNPGFPRPTDPRQTQSRSQNPNCSLAMSTAEYQNLFRIVSIAPDDRKKASAILDGASRSCLMTAQISQMVSTVKDENIKVDVLKRILPFVYDVENYPQVANILSPNTKPAFIQFLQNPNQQQAVTEVDFNNFLGAVQRQSFDKDKEEYIRTYMKNAYLTTTQIRAVIKLLSYDSSKLDAAKFLFDNCVDKQNYFTVSEEFTFSGSKNDLNEFVQSKM